MSENRTIWFKASSIFTYWPKVVHSNGWKLIAIQTALWVAMMAAMFGILHSLFLFVLFPALIVTFLIMLFRTGFGPDEDECIWE